MERPWLVLAACFGLGAMWGGLGGWLPPLMLLLGAASLRRRPGLALAVLAMAAGSSAALAGVHWHTSAPPAPEIPLMGEVLEVTLRGPRVGVTVAPDAHPGWRIQVWQDQRPRGLATGARVRLSGKLRRLAPADNPGGFDPARWGASRRIRWRMRGPVDLVVPAASGPEAAMRARLSARAHLDALDRPFGAAVLQGLLLGDRAAVPSEALRAFEATGTSHLLAVSGLHVGGLAAAVFWCLSVLARRLGAAEPARWAAAGALPVVWGFVALAQYPLSARRAGLMVGLYLLGRVLRRRADPLNLLGLAALVAMAPDPRVALEPGFQLSFGAVAALVTLGPKVRGVAGAAGVAVVAVMATAPVQAWHFGTFAPIAPAANLLLTPFAAMVLVPFGAAGLALAPWTLAPLGAAAVIAEIHVALAESLATLVGGVQVVGAHAAWPLAVPLALWMGHRAGRTTWGIVGGLVLAAIGVWAWPRGDVVDFVAVGQGDAVLVRSGRAAAMVDVGPERGARALVAYLRHEGIGRLRRVIITHQHPDHFGALLTLSTHTTIDEIWYGGQGSPLWWQTAKALRAQGIQVRRAHDGPITLGRVQMTVALSRPDTTLSENDASLTVRAQGTGGSVLLTGDLEALGEARLVSAGVEPVTVLKAPHHGSKTSSGASLLDATCPSAVVFTVGRNNWFGLPAPAVQAAYVARGVSRWRTDHDGRVRFDLRRGGLSALHRAPALLRPPTCAKDVP